MAILASFKIDQQIRDILDFITFYYSNKMNWRKT